MLLPGNFGRGSADPEHPLFDHVREVDYCSGAALATPRELFQRLGGFDAAFAPAYYEDTDYAFRLRQHGYRVYYQPESVVVRGLGTGYPALHHPDAIGAATDRSLRFTNTVGLANGIQALQGDGFQVGNDSLVNQSSGPTYAYFAWGQQTPPAISGIVKRV